MKADEAKKIVSDIENDEKRKRKLFLKEQQREREFLFKNLQSVAVAFREYANPFIKKASSQGHKMVTVDVFDFKFESKLPFYVFDEEYVRKLNSKIESLFRDDGYEVDCRYSNARDAVIFDDTGVPSSWKCTVRW